MRTFLASLVMVAVVLTQAAPGHAQTRNPYLDAGVRLFNDLEYEAALEQLKKASGTSPAEDIQIAFYRGLVRFELGDLAGAESDFKLGLSLDPEAPLPGKVSPKVSVLFDKARADIVKARPPKPIAPPVAPAAPAPTPAVAPASPAPAPAVTTAPATSVSPSPATKNPTSAPTTATAQTKPATAAPTSTATTSKPAPPTPKVVYLRPEPNGDDLPRAEPDHVRTLPRAVDPSALAPEEPSVTKPAGNSRIGRYIGGGAALVAGCVLGGFGASFGMKSSQSATDAKAAEWQSDAVTLRDQARNQALTANLLYGAAAVAVVTGVIVMLTGGD